MIQSVDCLASLTFTHVCAYSHIIEPDIPTAIIDNLPPQPQPQPPTPNNNKTKQQELALDCRTRACRALTAKSGWEKDAGRVTQVVAALEGLVESHVARPTVAGLAQCDLFLKAPLRKLGEEGSPWAGSPERGRLEAAQRRLRAKVEEMKQR